MLVPALFEPLEGVLSRGDLELPETFQRPKFPGLRLLWLKETAHTS
jgi:hypothetical protein